MSAGRAGETHLPARGPRGLRDARRNGEDPTFTAWGEALPIAEEHRGSLLDAEADAAYRWAAHAAAGRDVLDVGSGPGHGTSVLVEAGARSVVGVDADPGAVEAASRLYGATARFLQADPMALPLAPRSFDVVTCFGVLEDAADPDAILAGLRRILTDDGLLLASLATQPSAQGEAGGGGAARTGEEWRRALVASFGHVRLHRRRVCLAASVAPAERTGALPIDASTWVTGGGSEDRAILAAASEAALPELPTVASLTDLRDLRAYRDTLAAWEERARRAEADGSAKHWELVAAREAQRRLRKRLHEFEHRPLRMLSRVLRGRPARLGQGPPIRPAERGPEEWE